MKTVFPHLLAAQSIKRTLGIRRAAGYLRNNGFSIIEALEILL